MARKTVLVCDNCDNEIEDGRGATVRVNYTDARRGSRQADLCDECTEKIPGSKVGRRGRRPRAVATAA